MSIGTTSSPGGGFQASDGSVPLVDLLQVWSMNRFSGLVSVNGGSETGRLYFVDGEIVHAEAKDAIGEPALQVILGWPNGGFESFPNTSTLERTIKKRVSHLLLDAHRVLDERRLSPTPAPVVGPVPARARAAPVSSMGDQIRAIPGVGRLVRFGSDGRPAGEVDPEAEALAAKGLYLAMTHGAAVARAFGLRDLATASLRGAKESFVLVHSRGAYLCAAVRPDAAADQVEAKIRTLLTRPGGR